MDTIKDFWWAVVIEGRVNAVYQSKFEADIAVNQYDIAEVERVRITIDRIKS